MLIRLLMLMLTLSAATAPAADPLARRQDSDFRPLISELETRIPKAMRKYDVVGVSMALVDGPEIVWSASFGHADRQAHRPMTTDTLLQAGDFTMAVTAIAVLQLVEAGAFELDDPITSALPEMQLVTRFPEAPPPTVRQLLTHHGGLVNQVLAGSNIARPRVDLPPLAPVEVTQRSGTIYSYSQQGYSVLGHLVQYHSQQPYAEYVRDRIMQPLGMKDCDFGLQGNRGQRVAMGHNRKRRAEPNYYPRDISALGLLCPIGDMARLLAWMNRDDTRPVLSRSGVDEMLTVQNADVVLDLDNITGLAWQLTNTGRHRIRRVARLNGSMIHVRGLALLAPEERLGLVIVANSSTAIDLVLEIGRGSLDLMLQQAFGIIPPPPREHDLPDSIGLPEVARDDTMQPHYSTALGLASFAGRGNRLKMDFLGRGFSARRRDDGWFELAYRLLGVIDLRFNVLEEILVRPATIDGQSVLLSWYQGRQFLFGTALPSAAPTPELERLAGTYTLRNPDLLSAALDLDEVELEYEDGGLYANYRLPIFIPLRPRLPLRPIGPGRFVIPGLGTNLGETVQIDRRNGELVYSGYRFERD
jgi:CubicO group peptidase (beta-lactamase class C family)